MAPSFTKVACALVLASQAGAQYAPMQSGQSGGGMMQMLANMVCPMIPFQSPGCPPKAGGGMQGGMGGQGGQGGGSMFGSMFGGGGAPPAECGQSGSCCPDSTCSAINPMMGCRGDRGTTSCVGTSINPMPTGKCMCAGNNPCGSNGICSGSAAPGQGASGNPSGLFGGLTNPAGGSSGSSSGFGSGSNSFGRLYSEDMPKVHPEDHTVAIFVTSAAMLSMFSFSVVMAFRLRRRSQARESDLLLEDDEENELYAE
eukprot:TRINITY_DN49356_c0_g1_i1.p1 TRINITY_DN49356_c0_g1~~TRINITY_DN49356_c0_g1_i1.p1  ORF type:complete len:256 (+),score=59.74 TRINITY_DN49356_c0_g1_i1:174-941(+)